MNGDGVVNCSDVSIVKTAFGKRIGQPGFDVRADLNKDGVVDIRDLTVVSRNLPNGLTYHRPVAHLPPDPRGTSACRLPLAVSAPAVVHGGASGDSGDSNAGCVSVGERSAFASARLTREPIVRSAVSCCRLHSIALPTCVQVKAP